MEVEKYKGKITREVVAKMILWVSKIRKTQMTNEGMKWLAEEISKDFKTMNESDFVAAMKNGVKGLYNDSDFINVTTVYGWVEKKKEEVQMEHAQQSRALPEPEMEWEEYREIGKKKIKEFKEKMGDVIQRWKIES